MDVIFIEWLKQRYLSEVSEQMKSIYRGGPRGTSFAPSPTVSSAKKTSPCSTSSGGLQVNVRPETGSRSIMPRNLRCFVAPYSAEPSDLKVVHVVTRREAMDTRHSKCISFLCQFPKSF